MAEQEETQTVDNEAETQVESLENEKPAKNSEDTIDSDKVVEKLQKRIGKEQAEKNDLATQLESAKAELEKLKKPNVTKLSEEDKKAQAEKEKDNQIKDLQDQLKLTQSKVQTNEVFKEAGLSVSPEMLDMVVSTDDNTTYDQAKALIDFANAIKESARQEFLKGTTPAASGKAVATVTQSQFNAMTMAQKVQLHASDPEQFNKLTQN